MERVSAHKASTRHPLDGHVALAVAPLIMIMRHTDFILAELARLLVRKVQRARERSQLAAILHVIPVKGVARSLHPHRVRARAILLVLAEAIVQHELHGLIAVQLRIVHLERQPDGFPFIEELEVLTALG